MRIGINASFARKENTGIGQVTLNFLKKLSEFKVPALPAGRQSEKLKVNEFILYLEQDLPADIKLPDNPASSAGRFTKRIFLPLWKRDDLIRKIWWEKYLLPRNIKKDKCDVFISLYQSTTILANKIKHVMVVHDIIPKLFPEYLDNARKETYWRLTERAIKKADKIIAVSHRTEKDLVQLLGIEPEKIAVSYPDVDEIYKISTGTGHNVSVPKYRDFAVLKKYRLYPGYIYCGGGLEKRKNVDGVIRAYHYLLERNKKLRYVHQFPKLVISGRLMPRLAPLVTDAEKIVKKLNLTAHVVLLDFVPQEDLPVLYRNAVFFIYPSFYEGFGLPVLEAMNTGTPVIASRKSSLPEVGSDSALYCKPDDIEDMAMVMKNLLINKDLREKLSERGKERAKYFSMERFVEKVLNIVENAK